MAAATGSCRAPAYSSWRRSRAKKSAHLPGASEPMSSRPNTAAPPSVASSSAWRAVGAHALDGGDARAQPHVRGRAMRHTAAGAGIQSYLGLVDVHRVGKPDVI